jgi:hypothetical protein
MEKKYIIKDSYSNKYYSCNDDFDSIFSSMEFDSIEEAERRIKGFHDGWFEIITIYKIY